MQIPVLILIDVEPDGFFVPRDQPLPWAGFERGIGIVAEIRETIARRTGRAARFTWLVRADPQIDEVYGSPAWGLEHYRSLLEGLSAFGDEIGLHVHAYRWETGRGSWIEDYGNQPWVAHCVSTGYRAFETTLGRPPAVFSMGMDWTNQATVDLVRHLGVRYDLSTVPGTEPRPLRSLTGPYTGMVPDCTRLPRRPYQPSPHDFATPEHQSKGMWIFPQSSRIAPLDLSWKRRLYNGVRLQRVEVSARKFFLTDAPTSMRPAIGAALRDRPRPYLTFAVRTDEFCKRRSINAIRKNRDCVLEQAAEDLIFTTPAEALRILGCGAGNQEIAAAAS